MYLETSKNSLIIKLFTIYFQLELKKKTCQKPIKCSMKHLEGWLFGKFWYAFIYIISLSNVKITITAHGLVCSRAHNGSCFTDIGQLLHLQALLRPTEAGILL